MENLVIGCALGYSLSKIRPWIHTLRENAKYDDDVVLYTRGIASNEKLELLTDYKVAILDFPHGYQHTSPPHVARFEIISHFLRINSDKYKNSLVLTTDVRDVIFQDDPFLFRKMPTIPGVELVVSRENLKYKDEPWGKNNIITTMGYDIAQRLMETNIKNVGVFGGTHLGVMTVCGFIADWCRSTKPNAIMDQAVYNHFLEIPLIKNVVKESYDDEAWCVNLGTTKYAIEAGAGDIGMSYQRREVDLENYGYLEKQPIIENGKVFDPYRKQLYSIVHQWDRVPELRKAYKKLAY